MTIYHPARSLPEILLFLPALLRLPGSPHRLLVPTGQEFASRWLQPFRKLALRFFSGHIELVASSFEQFADLKVCPDPGVVATMGYKFAQAMWCGLVPADLPRQWLSPPAPTRQGVVLARSLVEQNEFFPWGQILTHYADHPLTFCGTLAEHESFSRRYPRAAFRWQDSTDLVAVAELLAHSQLLVSNQGAVAALADGVGLPTILEVSLLTQTMLHPRQHVFPSFGGRTFLPSLKDPGAGTWVTSEVPEKLLRVQWPTGYDVGWSHPNPERPRDELKFPTLEEAQVVVSQLYGREVHDPQVRESIVFHTLRRFPGELLPSLQHRSCQRVVRAMHRFGGPFPLKDYFFQPERPPELKLLTSETTPESSPIA